MALNKKEVTVLCPNGRRVTIKGTSSTSIGQIIEEACLKQNLDPLNYNLRHLKRMLDPSSTIQYSNIPNRAQLELIETEKRRQELNVIINFVTEEGQRLIGEFPSSTILSEVLLHYESNPENKFSLPAPSSAASPFIVYTMRKIIGEELKSVTLKSLGLYGGRCMMRYGTQQSSPDNCSKSSSSSPIVIVQKKPSCPKSCGLIVQEDTSLVGNTSLNDNEDHNPVPGTRTEGTLRLFHTEDKPVPDNIDVEDGSSLFQTENTYVSTIEEPSESLKNNETEIPVDISSPEPCAKLDSRDVMECEASIEESATQGNEIATPKIISLASDRKSVLFSMDDAPSTVHTDEGDSFFDLTTAEVRSLHSEQVKQLREMEEAPLMTLHLRELERDSRLLSAMNQYPVTQLRIFFPDHHVIQVDFRPYNTVQEVMDFLKPFLIRSDLNFYLFTLHPRKVLDPSFSLVDAGCIPKARLYFKSDDTDSPLSDETLSKKSTFEAAASAVIKAKVGSSARAQTSEGHGTSSKSSSQNSEAQNGVRSQSTQKPKWFKLGK